VPGADYDAVVFEYLRHILRSIERLERFELLEYLERLSSSNRSNRSSRSNRLRTIRLYPSFKSSFMTCQQLRPDPAITASAGWVATPTW
jgi:hypothetical protein